MYIMTYIYESPDGGHTVFRRETGSDRQELHSISEQKRKWDQQVEEEMLWVKVFQASRTNPALQQALERALVIYRLTQND
jgi:hypothetical protein